MRSNSGIQEFVELHSIGEPGSFPPKIKESVDFLISAVNGLESLWEGSNVAIVSVSEKRSDMRWMRSKSGVHKTAELYIIGEPGSFPGQIRNRKNFLISVINCFECLWKGSYVGDLTVSDI